MQQLTINCIFSLRLPSIEYKKCQILPLLCCNLCNFGNSCFFLSRNFLVLCYFINNKVTAVRRWQSQKILDNLSRSGATKRQKVATFCYSTSCALRAWEFSARILCRIEMRIFAQSIYTSYMEFHNY
jgi:hypothetical protein